jgi:hypothetical protein
MVTSPRIWLRSVYSMTSAIASTSPSHAVLNSPRQPLFHGISCCFPLLLNLNTVHPNATAVRHGPSVNPWSCSLLSVRSIPSSPSCHSPSSILARVNLSTSSPKVQRSPAAHLVQRLRTGSSSLSSISSDSSGIMSVFVLFGIVNPRKWRSVRRTSVARVGGISALLNTSQPAVVAFSPAISFAILTLTFWIWSAIHCWPS